MEVGIFTEVILNPIVTVADVSMVEKANGLHHKASKQCFIASSVNFPGTSYARVFGEITSGENA